jgi:hypothetical protein
MIAFVVLPYLEIIPLSRSGEGVLTHGWPIDDTGGQTPDRVDLKIDAM